MNPYFAGASPSRAINPPGISDPTVASMMAGSTRITYLSPRKEARNFEWLLMADLGRSVYGSSQPIPDVDLV
jgi:hypothetical protein